jgi:hypothetical protein
VSDIRAQVAVTNNWQAVMGSILTGAVRGQNKAGDRLLALAVARVPEDTGDLLGAGQVVNAERPGDDTIVVFDRPQAARLHEHPEYNFSKDANPNAQGKYLEGPAIENRAELLKIIATELKREQTS